MMVLTYANVREANRSAVYPANKDRDRAVSQELNEQMVQRYLDFLNLVERNHQDKKWKNNSLPY